MFTVSPVCYDLQGTVAQVATAAAAAEGSAQQLWKLTQYQSIACSARSNSFSGTAVVGRALCDRDEVRSEAPHCNPIRDLVHVPAHGPWPTITTHGSLHCTIV